MNKIENSREDYLKAIYDCMQVRGFATNKDLAQILGVRAASVTEMIKRLVHVGEVYLVKKDIYLTETGLLEVKKLLTKHRLWETFLVGHLGYSWEDVHADADVLEHVTSDRLKDRLNEFLHHPKHCPHGNEIFENHSRKDEVKSLAHVAVGEHIRIHKVVDEKNLLEYLDEKKLHLKSEMVVKSIDKFDGTIFLLSEGKELFVSLPAAEKIMVTEEK